MSGFLRVVLQFSQEIKDPAVRAEFEQLVASLQSYSTKQIPIGNGGLGVDASQIDDGEIPIGDGTLKSFVLNRLSAGAGIGISSTAGHITISATGSSVPGAGYAPVSTGAEPLEIMSDGAGAVLMIGYTP